MDFENEKPLENRSEEQNAGGREGYQENGYPRAGRTPRPRIQGQRAYTPGRSNYNRTENNNEGGFRPEGFGSGLGNGAASQRQYRPRFNNNNEEGGYQPRQQQTGGYRPRYNNNNGENSGYRPRYNNNNGNSEGGYRPRQQQTGSYRPRYNNNEAGGYQPRQQGGYGNRQQGGYNNNRGSYGNNRQQGGYNNNRGGYGNNRQQGGYNNRRQHTADYDPHAKYSMKKRIEYKEEHYDPNEPIRLNKFLANAGVCSRREADDFIQAGVVTVNGEVMTELGTKVLRTDEVRFHDQPVTIEKKVYVLLNKPKDYVTTSDDPQQRKTVLDLVKDACTERIYPVGRLDRNTTGVLLLTNDGDLASKLTHPKFLKKKIYHVYLDHNVTAHDMQQIAEGITLEDGDIKADDIQYADPVDKKQVGIEIHSGKNRIVRRIFEHFGYKVTKLDRVLFAGLTKKNLRRGDWRYLTEEEVDRLRMGAYE
ncbi:MAG: rRNA pseudouridine synthase [Prevotella sp.]|nr:rRNA pseudouridine synthase [Prevotella sp.]